MRPLIGITGGFGTLAGPVKPPHETLNFHYLCDAYIHAVWKSGGIPVFLTATEQDAIEELLPRLDGLLLSGGEDLNPASYGQRAIAQCGNISMGRDAFELSVAKRVMEDTRIPVLGICRGEQVLNAACGGSLYQDLESEGYLAHQLSMYPRYAVSHKVIVEKESRLAGIVGAGSIGVNSFHHQAVQMPAPGFIVTAYSEDDRVIEAIELPGERFVLGVQWHPEAMVDSDETQLRLIRAFVAACSAR